MIKWHSWAVRSLLCILWGESILDCVKSQHIYSKTFSEVHTKDVVCKGEQSWKLINLGTQHVVFLATWLIIYSLSLSHIAPSLSRSLALSLSPFSTQSIHSQMDRLSGCSPSGHIWPGSTVIGPKVTQPASHWQRGHSIGLCRSHLHPSLSPRLLSTPLLKITLCVFVCLNSSMNVYILLWLLCHFFCRSCPKGTLNYYLRVCICCIFHARVMWCMMISKCDFKLKNLFWNNG